MELEKYQDVHPNWHHIEDLSEAQANDTLKLLLAGVFLDGKLTPGELQALAESWQHLPFVGEKFAGSTLEDLLAQTHDELEEILEEPERFEGFLESVTDKFDDQEVEIAVLRLLAIVLTEDGTDEREQMLLFAVGRHFELEPDTIDDLLRSVWESYEQSLSVSKPGNKRAKPLAQGRRFAQNRKTHYTANPFTTPLT